jgi:hypothetical protein
MHAILWPCSEMLAASDALAPALNKISDGELTTNRI